jgi:hypothetical protein
MQQPCPKCNPNWELPKLQLAESLSSLLAAWFWIGTFVVVVVVVLD